MIVRVRTHITPAAAAQTTKPWRSSQGFVYFAIWRMFFTVIYGVPGGV